MLSRPTLATCIITKWKARKPQLDAQLVKRLPSHLGTSLCGRASQFKTIGSSRVGDFREFDKQCGIAIRSHQRVGGQSLQASVSI